MRISGITIPDNKRLKVGLTVLYGIGLPLSKSILAKAKESVKEVKIALSDLHGAFTGLVPEKMKEEMQKMDKEKGKICEH